MPKYTLRRSIVVQLQVIVKGRDGEMQLLNGRCCILFGVKETAVLRGIGQQKGNEATMEGTLAWQPTLRYGLLCTTG